MEKRIYFIAGDILSNGIAAIVAAMLATGIVDPSWHMLPAMLVGMVAAMGLSMLLMPLLVGLFGAMEVMLPVMLSAMLAGMVFAMAETMSTLSLMQVLAGGACCGILVLVVTYVVNIRLQGRHR